MNEPLVLRGYHYSVYNRIARVALHEKGVEYEVEDINPFSAEIPNDYLKRHPFRRVPVLSHGTFDVYETAAITRYVDAAFDGPAMLPDKPEVLARAAQVVSIVDSYGYSPMVRQVFAHSVFRRAAGVECDEAEVARGLEASLPVLNALNTLASEGHVLDGKTFTIADCHLAPMIAYFRQAPEGADALAQYSALSEWWNSTTKRRSMAETDPGLPKTN
ncbi:MAG: glutathione S-transferase family protein [Pseudomonadota bacterium]